MQSQQLFLQTGFVNWLSAKELQVWSTLFLDNLHVPNTFPQLQGIVFKPTGP